MPKGQRAGEQIDPKFYEMNNAKLKINLVVSGVYFFLLVSFFHGSFNCLDLKQNIERAEAEEITSQDCL